MDVQRELLDELEHLRRQNKLFGLEVMRLKQQNHVLLVELGRKRADEPVPDYPGFGFSNAFTVRCQAEMARVRENIEKLDALAHSQAKRIREAKAQGEEMETVDYFGDVALWEKYHGGILFALKNYLLFMSDIKDIDDE